MEGFERFALAGRWPTLPGLKDIGIRKGTFTFLLDGVVVDVGCEPVEDGRGGGEVGVGSVFCGVVGGRDGSIVDDADVVWGGCEVAVEDS